VSSASTRRLPLPCTTRGEAGAAHRAEEEHRAGERTSFLRCLLEMKNFAWGVHLLYVMQMKLCTSYFVFHCWSRSKSENLHLDSVQTFKIVGISDSGAQPKNWAFYAEKLS
jgi:hypothetical protein